MADLFSQSSAVISPCQQYRYRLGRQLADRGPVVALFGVNPSTADAAKDDHTVTKWMGFGRRLGWSRFIVGNVFSYRATDVKRLATPGLDPFGPDHDAHIAAIIAEADVLAPCWGDRGKIPRGLRPHMDRLLDRLNASGKPVKCWGLSKAGDPLHVLTLGYATPFVDFSRATPHREGE